MRPSRLLPLAAVAALTALAGCGPTGTSKSSSKNFTGAKKDVAQTVDDLASAAGKRDAKAICTELLAPALQQKLGSGGSSCQTVIADQLKDADLATLDTRSVTIDGQHATAVVRSQYYGKDRDVTVMLVRGAGGAWRISGIQP